MISRWALSGRWLAFIFRRSLVSSGGAQYCPRGTVTMRGASWGGSAPLGLLPWTVSQSWPTGRGSLGRPRNHWCDYISQQVQEHFGITQTGACHWEKDVRAAQFALHMQHWTDGQTVLLPFSTRAVSILAWKSIMQIIIIPQQYSLKK